MSRPVDKEKLIHIINAVCDDDLRQESLDTLGYRWDPFLSDYEKRLDDAYRNEALRWGLEVSGYSGYGLSRTKGVPDFAPFEGDSEWSPVVPPLPPLLGEQCFYRMIRVVTPQKRDPKKQTTLGIFALEFKDKNDWAIQGDLRIVRVFKGVAPNPYLSIYAGKPNNNNVIGLRKQPAPYRGKLLDNERSRYVNPEWTGVGNSALIKVKFNCSHPFSVGAVTLGAALREFLFAGMITVDVNILRRAVSAING